MEVVDPVNRPAVYKISYRANVRRNKKSARQQNCISQFFDVFYYIRKGSGISIEQTLISFSQDYNIPVFQDKFDLKTR